MIIRTNSIDVYCETKQIYPKKGMAIEILFKMCYTYKIRG